MEHNCQARDISTVALCLVMAVSSSLEARMARLGVAMPLTLWRGFFLFIFFVFVERCHPQDFILHFDIYDS